MVNKFKNIIVVVLILWSTDALEFSIFIICQWLMAPMAPNSAIGEISDSL